MFECVICCIVNIKAHHFSMENFDGSQNSSLTIFSTTNPNYDNKDDQRNVDSITVQNERKPRLTVIIQILKRSSLLFIFVGFFVFSICIHGKFNLFK